MAASGFRARSGTAKISRVNPDKLSPAQIEDAPRDSRPRLLHQSIKFFRDEFDQGDPTLLRHEAARPVKRRISTTPGIDGLAARHSRRPADRPQRETLAQQRQETFAQLRGGYPGTPWAAWLRRWTAVVLSAARRIGAGQQTVAQTIETTEERCHEAELHRMRGNFLHAAGDPSASELNYRQAITVAERQSARLLQLRASTSLARLWRDQGKRTEDRDLLGPIYNWFTEGFDAPDLKDAKVLLDELI